MHRTNDADRERAVAPWRARIGVGADFPLHAPTDVERAMEQEIAELREELAARIGIELLVADDAYAVSFQSMAQYRGALLAAARGDRKSVV